MSETVLKLVLILARVAILALVVSSAFVVLFAITSGIMIVLNTPVLNDIYLIVQLWLPFNIGPVIAWIMLVGGGLITYGLANKALRYIINATS